MSADESELRPCPFCGGPATAYTGILRHYCIACPECDICISERSKPKAAEAWNARPTPSAAAEGSWKHAAECGRMKDALYMLRQDAVDHADTGKVPLVWLLDRLNDAYEFKPEAAVEGEEDKA